jgi:hypothetical protein
VELTTNGLKRKGRRLSRNRRDDSVRARGRRPEGAEPPVETSIPGRAPRGFVAGGDA